jgi:hypothetical protein
MERGMVAADGASFGQLTDEGLILRIVAFEGPASGGGSIDDR